MTRYIMSARPQGKLHMQRTMAPDVETLVRKWLVQHLGGFYLSSMARTGRREGPGESDGVEPAHVGVRVAVLLGRRGWRRQHGRRCDVA